MSLCYLSTSLRHSSLGLLELWIGFVSGKAYTDIPIPEVLLQLEQHNCMPLQVVTCNVTSSRAGLRVARA